jgi:rubrerythrin
VFQRTRRRQLTEHPIRPCDCGCGHTFVADMSNRSRKFAPDCPRAAERISLVREREQERQRQKQAELRAQRTDSKRQGGRRVPGTDGIDRRSVKVCSACGNLPERRPPEGCSKCTFPAGPPAPLTPFVPSLLTTEGWVY